MRAPSPFLPLASLLLSFAATLAAEEPRTIRVDAAAPGSPASSMWRECVGAGRVGEGLYPEWRRQLTVLQKEIGFRSLRAHGLYHDELGVYREKPDGTPIYDFTKVDLVYDHLLSNGIRPFVEFGPSPRALAWTNKTTFWWKALFCVPSDLDKWSELVKATVKHWQERYGIEETRKWNYEVWNEPNHVSFFTPRVAGKSLEEYRDLYAATARAVKSVDPRLQVGGPATAGLGWIRELQTWCHSNEVPLDFLSTHTYASTSGPLDEFGKKQQFMSTNLTAVANGVKWVRSMIESGPFPGHPLHLTEWSTTPSPREKSHDTYQAAPFILEQLKASEGAAQSMSYWVFTDIFEEAGPTTLPFQGCFGMMTVDGVRKPSWHVYRFLASLGRTELPTDDGRSMATRSDDGSVQVLLWDYREPVPAGTPTVKHFGVPRPSEPLGDAKVEIAGLAPGAWELRLTRIGYQANDPYTLWMTDLGRTTNLEPAQREALQAASKGDPERIEKITVGADGKARLSTPLRTFDCVLVQLTRKP